MSEQDSYRKPPSTLRSGGTSIDKDSLRGWILSCKSVCQTGAYMCSVVTVEQAVLPTPVLGLFDNKPFSCVP
jgi:hypothetical protein